MTELILVRHGQAQPYVDASSDSARQLTELGRQQSLELLRQHQAELAQAELILCSPFCRAQQSAELIVNLSADCTGEIQLLDALTPENSPQQLVQLLQQTTLPQRLVLVGHNPLFSDLLNHLLGKPKGFYYFGTSGMAALSLPVMAADCAELRWLEAGY